MLGYVTIISSIAYMLIIWCAGKIWRRLSATKHLMSQKTRIMHRQLTYALVAQVCFLDFVNFLDFLHYFQEIKV
jgi:hypothetical protein